MSVRGESGKSSRSEHVSQAARRRFREMPIALLIGCFLFAGLVMGQESAENQAEGNPVEETNPSEGDSADRGRIILVVGAAGTKEFGNEFAESAERWRETAKSSGMKIDVVGLQSLSEETDRQQVKRLLEGMSGQENSHLWLVLIGHGTFARDQAKFNLRGPDFSAKELSSWLQNVKRPLVVVNCSSASGPFVNRLSGPNRVVVSATKSGAEQNYARFGKYFAEAITSADSDLDHDGEVSVHEAFLRASAGVESFYEGEGRIATEHALIDDNGDGLGTPASLFRGVRPSGKAKDGAKLDGAAAARVTLAPAGGRLPFTQQELVQRDQIEKQLNEMRQRRDQMDQQRFDAAVEPLLLQLARLYAAAEARVAASGNAIP